MWELHPLANLALGMGIVLGMIIVLRANAFLALLVAAIAVSLFAPGAATDKISRVAIEFGSSAGKFAIVIALASIIGECMMASGAADRVVRFFLRLLGQRQAPMALMGSGFVLAVPVFFDTVFYLLVPLARSLYKRTGVNYLLYVLAITAGGAVTHTLVPPTPGPLIMAGNLNIDIGLMILAGGLIALPVSLAGLAFAFVANRLMPMPMRDLATEPEHESLDDADLPPLWLSAFPVALPVVLISSNTAMKALADKSPGVLASWDAALYDGFSAGVATSTSIVGDPNLAMLLATVVAMGMLKWKRRLPFDKLSRMVETSLMSAGVIILITAAGGAFGAMLTAAKIGPEIENLAAQVSQVEGGSAGELSGTALILLGFGVAAVLKIALGSSTVAMITASGILASIVQASTGLEFNPVYIATAIGSGSLIGSWMNDSGFWIVVKMSGMTETEGLRTWTLQLITLGATGLVASLVLSQLLPLTG